MDAESVLRKLRYKFEYKSVILNAPKGLIEEFEKAGFSTVIDSDEYEFTLLFVKDRKEVEEHFQSTVERIKYDSVFWISYPKGTGRIKTDINRDKLWDMLKTYGYRPVSQVAIDQDWSAMRFRPTEKVKSK